MGENDLYRGSQQKSERACTDLNIQVSQLHGSQLIHGTTSAALLAFTEYNRFEGNLLPTGMLAKEGKIPFGGELGFGVRQNGINQSHLSTVWVGSFQYALGYTKIQDVPLTSSDADVVKLRSSQNLTEFEKMLVSEKFPVIFGIRPNRENACPIFETSISGEVSLLEGTKKGEIKVIFVPPEKVSLVQELVKTHGIAVEPFSDKMSVS